MIQVYGYDVLEIEPNTEQERSSDYQRLLTVFDSKTGKLSQTDRNGVASVNPKGFLWTMFGRAEIDAYRDFLALRKGACNPFWIPSWQHDLLMASDVVANSTALVVQAMGYTKFFWPSASRHYLAFATLDGLATRYYRKVTAAVEGAMTETLTLDSRLSATQTVKADQCMVSFLTLVRLSMDDPLLTWHTRDVADVLLDFVELPEEVTA